VFKTQNVRANVAFEPLFDGIENLGFLLVRGAVVGRVGHRVLLGQSVNQ
jgi:hypothetical protein